MLRTAFSMIPNNTCCWAKNGQIDIMTNVQDNKLTTGIHYGIPAKYEYNTSGVFSTLSNLNDFHTYSIEWNESEIKWFFDDIKRFTININQNLSSQYIRVGEPFDKTFRLQIQLGVGGGGGDDGFFPYKDLSLEDVINWKCSLLIIDYVRIYKWENGSQILSSISNKVSVDKICQEVMPLIAPKTSATVLIVSIIGSFLLLFFNTDYYILINTTNKSETK
jgi:hypothetical protein